MDVKDLLALMELFRDLDRKYKIPLFSNIVRIFELSLNLSNLKLFVLAVESATQDEYVPSLIWGAVTPSLRYEHLRLFIYWIAC